MIWTGILTIPIAILQAIASCLVFFLVSALAVGFGVEGGTIYTHLEDLTGYKQGPWMYNLFTVLALGSMNIFIICVLLCRGLCMKKIELVVPYTVCGVTSVILRASLIRGAELANFPAEKTILYWALFGLYLVLLVINIVEIKIKEQHQEKTSTESCVVLLDPYQ